MNSWVAFVNRMNLLLWVAVIFLFHLVLYLSLGTDNWLWATIAATATYTLVLVGLKSLARRKKRGVH
ncbi:MAG TPA: hypothetical protein VFV52_09950 [Bacilli bacterium]|nr:hypothetical protein [Bacilli bacterium]